MSAPLPFSEQDPLNTLNERDGASLKNNQQRIFVGFGACSSSSVLNSVEAGYVAGISGVLVGHPFETAKVWRQTNKGIKGSFLKNSAPSLSSAIRKKNSGSFSRSLTAAASNSANMSTCTPGAHSQIRKFQALYSGVTGPLLTTGVLQCMNFAIYDTVRRILHRYDHKHAGDADYLCSDSLLNVAIAGFTAGSFLTLFNGPLIKVKLNQQIKGKGFKQALCDTLRPEGSAALRKLSNGIGVHFACETLFRVINYTAYERLKRSIMMRKDDASITLEERMVSAAIAGTTSWTIIFPLDAVRSRVVAQSTLTPKSSLDMVCTMYCESRASGSLKPYYRGFGLALFRGGLVAAVVLPVYDLSLKWFSA